MRTVGATGTDAADGQVYRRLVDEYLQHLWTDDPAAATAHGVHQGDGRLGEYTVEAEQDYQRRRRDLLDRLRRIDRGVLEPADQVDYPFLMGLLEADASSTAIWRGSHGPRDIRRTAFLPPQRITQALFPLMAGDFAPVEERISSIVGRVNEIEAWLEQARHTVTGVPELWLQRGVTAARAARQFVVQAVPEFARASVPGNSRQIGEIERAARRAAEALDAYERHLAGLTTGRSATAAGPHWAAGPEVVDDLLRHYHLLDMDHNDLYDFGLEEVDRYTGDLIRLARRMGYGDDWMTAIEEVKDHHPAAQEVVRAYEAEVQSARSFMLEHELVTVPPEGHCPTEWMPAFMRPFAAMGLPRPSPAFDPGYHGSWYIAPVDRSAAAEVQRDHLRENNYAFIRAISHHEIFPGHYMQYLVAKLSATDIGKTHTSMINTEGWTLYWEEYLVELGYLGEPAQHLMQLRNALWRAVRVVVDAGLHCRGMTLDQAAGFLMEKARLDWRWAKSEAERYTVVPTNPSTYLLGKREVVNLKKAYRRLRGADFSDKEFHDHYLSFGTVPVRVIREAMLGG